MSIQNAAIYARVSRPDGQQDTDNQLIKLRAYCEAQGWDTHEYTDRRSAKRSDRKEFQRMMQDAKQRRFDVVVVWALDRLSREGVHANFRSHPGAQGLTRLRLRPTRYIT
jgi:DNA invertase Pin-like site-specific DNA recombinase